MSEFVKQQRNPFRATFARAKDQDGYVVYRTYFGFMGQPAEYIETRVDEKKAAADGLDSVQIATAIKGDHYNKITELLHAELVRVLNVEAV